MKVKTLNASDMKSTEIRRESLRMAIDVTSSVIASSPTFDIDLIDDVLKIAQEYENYIQGNYE